MRANVYPRLMKLSSNKGAIRLFSTSKLQDENQTDPFLKRLGKALVLNSKRMESDPVYRKEMQAMTR